LFGIVNVFNPKSEMFKNPAFGSMQEYKSLVEKFEQDYEGTWGKLHTGGFLRATGTLFLLNRTHMENVRVAIIMEP